jgi:hypothetical protein
LTAADILDLRRALDEAYSAALRPSPEYVDPVDGEVIVKASHIAEIRSYVVALQQP